MIKLRKGFEFETPKKWSLRKLAGKETSKAEVVATINPKVLSSLKHARTCTRDAELALCTTLPTLMCQSVIPNLPQNKVPSYIRSLTDAYQIRYAWWEAVECMRKMLLCGLLMFLDPGQGGFVLRSVTHS